MIAELIAAHHRGWPGPWLEDDIFGMHEPEHVAAELEAFIGRPIAAGVFYEASVGVVAGFRLGDGSSVVVKAHRPSVSLEQLGAVHTPGLAEGALANPDALWPAPHHSMFDFEATRNGTATEFPPDNLREPLARHAAEWLRL